MRPAPFSYFAPRSAEEAVQELARHGGEARLLAGGQSLVPLLNLRMARPAVLIDLGRCRELAYLERQGDWLVAGPMTRQADAERSALVKEACPLLAAALPFVGPPTVRSRGTLGGTLAHADRLAELPAVALALGAEIVAQGPGGRRTLPAAEFFVGDLANALQPGEMLREIRFPVARGRTACAFEEATVRHHDLMLLGVAAHLELDGEGRCTRASLAVVGGAPVPQRLAAAEAALIGAPLHEAGLRKAASVSGEGIALEGDTYASERYRRRILPVLVERVLSRALSGTTHVH